jgi:hypothetical protein
MTVAALVNLLSDAPLRRGLRPPPRSQPSLHDGLRANRLLRVYAAQLEGYGIGVRCWFCGSR